MTLDIKETEKTCLKYVIFYRNASTGPNCKPHREPVGEPRREGEMRCSSQSEPFCSTGTGSYCWQRVWDCPPDWGVGSSLWSPLETISRWWFHSAWSKYPSWGSPGASWEFIIHVQMWLLGWRGTSRTQLKTVLQFRKPEKQHSQTHSLFKNE